VVGSPIFVSISLNCFSLITLYEATFAKLGRGPVRTSNAGFVFFAAFATFPVPLGDF
jgi:hypothetical protein